jgi:hypothetical protein
MLSTFRSEVAIDAVCVTYCMGRVKNVVYSSWLCMVREKIRLGMNEIIKKTGEEVMETAANSAENTAVESASVPMPSRRRLVQAGLAAAPVVLALSGRSAMATGGGGTSTPGALSAVAWLSANPANGGTASASRSPRASGASGIAVNKWKPVQTTTTFPSCPKWPTGCKPFDKIVKVTTDLSGKAQYTEMFFNAAEFKTYSGLTYQYSKNGVTQDSGWTSGTVLSWLDNRSISKLLIDEAGSDTLKANVCAAYLSALLAEQGGPAYLLSSAAVKTIYQTKTLGTTVVSPTNLLAFFKQTLA